MGHPTAAATPENGWVPLDALAGELDVDLSRLLIAADRHTDPTGEAV
jgi:hypothetical protein